MKFNMSLEFTIDTANVSFILKILSKPGLETFKEMNITLK
jgi:hypothetical protein